MTHPEAYRVTLAALRLEHLRRTRCSADCDHVIALRRVAREVTDHLAAASQLRDTTIESENQQ